MGYIFVGKIVNTHGIKGEIRINSNFEYKDRIFKVGQSIYIGDEKQKEEITSYRHHKIFEMITLKNYNNINNVLQFLKKNVYVLKEDITLDNDEYLETDIIGLKIIDDNLEIGSVLDIYNSGIKNKVLEAIINNKKVLIPYRKEFIKRVDFNKKEIEFNLIEGMI